MKKTSGTYKIKLIETYKGLPVVGEAVVVEVSDKGEPIGNIRGHLVEGIEKDIPSIKPALSPEQAVEAALNTRGHPRDDVTFDPDRDAQLVILAEGNAEEVRPVLAYKLSYRIEKPGILKRPSFYIDATTGAVLRHWEGISFSNHVNSTDTEANVVDHNAIPNYILVNGEGGNLKTGRKSYDGEHLPKLRVTQLSNTTCSLKNSRAIVYNCHELYECPQGMRPHEFDCDSENPDYINGAYSPLNDVLFHMSVTFEMYEEWYSLTDFIHTPGTEGNRCVARVHYGRNLETAFWDGQYISIGDGGNTYYPLTSMDIIAHEMSHGFTEKNSGLYYEDESGAINEAFSDMAGEAAEEYLQKRVDWMVGQEITKDGHNSMRFFENPQDDGRSISHLDEFCFNMDPHMGSGLFNKVFFDLSHTPGWDIRQAFHVFVVANHLYWGPDSSFQQAACDTLQSAQDLDLNVTDVQKAFEVVGIIPCERKDTTILINPIRFDGKTPITYEVHSDSSRSLRYTDLVFYLFGNTPIGVTVTGPSYRYVVEPENSMYSFIDNNAVAIHTFTQCQHHKCRATIQTYKPGKVILMPLAFVSTLFSEGVLRHSGQRIQIEFEIPDYVLKSRLRVAFTAERMGTDMSVYIRHLDPPIIETAEFELSGHTKLPMLLCTPKPGIYHLHVTSDSGGVSNISIKMYALLEAARIP